MSNATLDPQTENPSPQPPEESVWHRYSPHYEAPLSSAGSLALHVLFIGLLILLGFVASMFGLNQPKKQPPIELAQIVQGTGPAAGAPGAPGGPAGEKTPERRPEEDIKQNPERKTEPEAPREKLDPAQIASLPQAIRNDPFVQEYIARGNVNLDIFNKVGTKIRLPDPPAPPGQGGTGANQGPGPGGQGGMGGMGDGSPRGDLLSKREKRMLRWKMMFDTRSGDHYVAQLSSLGAILGIPKAPAGGDYWLVRDLTRRPAPLLNEDWTRLGRIQWTDGSPKSARDVATTLGLPFIPTHFIAFMPESLELKLSELEKKYRGLDEDRIFETHFQIVQIGPRVYEPRVVQQIPK